MFRQFSLLSLIFSTNVVVLFCLGYPQNTFASEMNKTFIAFSLKAAQKIIQNKKGERQTVFSLGNITKPFGLVVDRKTGDCIVVGQRDHTRPEIQLDDLIVAMRSVFVYKRQEAPGVSINPRGNMQTATMQDVQYFGGVEGTRFGKVCFEADYLMKKIGLGLQSAQVEGFETYFDLFVDEISRFSDRRSEVGSRFWFYPIVARVVSAGDGVFLDQCNIVVLTEIMYAYLDGQPIKDFRKFHHRPSDKYSQSFSSHLPEIAKEYPVLTDLQNMTELAALAKGLSKMGKLHMLDYWFNKYQPEQVDTERELPILVNHSSEARFRLQGGVYLQSLVLRLKKGDPSALTEVVLATRPKLNSLLWSFTLTRNWQVIVNSLSGEVDVSTAAEYYTRAEYLFNSHQYDMAIACWRQVAKIYPNMGELYFKMGAAFERKEMPACAADYYTKGLKLDPFLKNIQKALVK